MERHMVTKSGRTAKNKVGHALHKRGTLCSGSGRRVTSRKQAIAIGLSEARKAGSQVPARKTSARTKRASKKRS
jgi:hypothetical protein